MSNKPFIPSFDDIVFENRNRAYGAYVIRKRKERTAAIAFVAGLIFMMAVIKLPYLIMDAMESMRSDKEEEMVIGVDMDETLPEPPKPLIDEATPPPPPPPPPPTTQVTEMTQSTVTTEPEPVEQVDPDKMLKTQDQQVNTAPANSDYTPPSGDAGTGDPVAQETVDMSAVEEKPLFSGDLNKFLSSNLNYPEECVEGGIQGRVIVEFVVGTDGKITDVSVKRGVHALLDREAMRVVKSMPAWTPGRQGGKAVPVRYRQPITFQLGG